MPVFEYKAIGPGPRTAEGRIEAGGRQEALRVLQGQGLRPVRVVEAANGNAARAAAKPWGEGLTLFARKVTGKDRERFTRQLSSLLAAGVPLSRALHILSREGTKPQATACWRQVRELVVDGVGLADAMARQPEVFPRVYTAMVRAGETGGFLAPVLGQIADFQARDKELRARLASAMVYPAVLLALTLSVMVFLLTFFIPRFQAMFEELGAPLPALTRAIIAASEFMVGYGLLIGVGVAVGAYALNRWLRSAEGRRVWQRRVLDLPVFGDLTARFALTRFCRMLGTLTRSGVELVTALQVSRESLGNQTLIDTLTDAIERVRRGQTLASSLATCPQLFPGSVVEMVSVAEESSRLDEELVRLADEAEKELDAQFRVAVSLAEPALLFLMAAVIGTIFIGMVIPIFSIQDYIN